jgi:hypothetical protein
MSKSIITIHNAETNEIIVREMTEEEQLQHDSQVAASLVAQAKAEASAAEKQALLDKLGITADEAKLLLG